MTGRFHPQRDAPHPSLLRAISLTSLVIFLYFSLDVYTDWVCPAFPPPLVGRSIQLHGDCGSFSHFDGTLGSCRRT